MTEAQTASSAVEVAVDPVTAFKAFTEEMDMWWARGPINFWSDGGRVVEVRCEPGVGGRTSRFSIKPIPERSWNGDASRAGNHPIAWVDEFASMTSRPRCASCQPQREHGSLWSIGSRLGVRTRAGPPGAESVPRPVRGLVLETLIGCRTCRSTSLGCRSAFTTRAPPRQPAGSPTSSASSQ